MIPIHCPCFDWFCDKVADDTVKLYTDLEPRPCRRAIAMLVQLVPVLVVLFFLMWVFLNPPPSHHNTMPPPGAVVLFIVTPIGAIALIYVVCCDMYRAARQYSEGDV